MDRKKQGLILFALFSVCALVGMILIVFSLVPRKESEKPAAMSLSLPRAALTPRDTIAVLNVLTPIAYSVEEDYFGLQKSGVLNWVSMLRSVENNPNVRAVLLRVNSPGGTIAATQELYNQILRLKKKDKLVVVSMGDIAASGAYYISCAADYIVANPGSLTGSIGVIIQSLDFSGLMKKIGVNYNVIKSGKNKDILSGYRSMTDEERKLLQSVVMDSYDQFFRVVSKGRKIRPQSLRTLADGRVFTGRQALKLKLVDELGDYEDAVATTARLAGIRGLPNIMELRPESRGFFRYLTSSFFRMVSGGSSEGAALIREALPKLSGQYSPVLYLYSH